jgi:hypothetical protein
MHALMGTSPIIDTSAIAHSMTDIDLTVLQPSNNASQKLKPKLKATKQSVCGVPISIIYKYLLTTAISRIIL